MCDIWHGSYLPTYIEQSAASGDANARQFERETLCLIWRNRNHHSIVNRHRPRPRLPVACHCANHLSEGASAALQHCILATQQPPPPPPRPVQAQCHALVSPLWPSIGAMHFDAIAHGSYVDRVRQWPDRRPARSPSRDMRVNPRLSVRPGSTRRAHSPCVRPCSPQSHSTDRARLP